MSPSPNLPAAAEHPLAERLRDFTRLIGLGAAGFGVAGALGGLLVPDVAVDRWQLPHLAPALVLVLAGLSLFLHLPPAWAARWSGLRKPLAVLAGIIAGVGTVIHLSGLGDELPHFAFRSIVSMPGGILVALSLLLLQRPGRAGRIAWLIAAAMLAVTLVFLIDYLYAFQSTAVLVVIRQPELWTAVAYAALGLGLLLADPARSPMRSLRSLGPGGVMTRRLLVPALALPLLLLWLFRLAVPSGLIDLDFGYTLTTSLLVVSLAVLIIYEARAMDRLASEAQLQLAQVEADYLRRLGLAVEAAELYLWEYRPSTGRLHHAGHYVRSLGYDPEQARDIDWWIEIADPDDVRRMLPVWEELRTGARELLQGDFRVRDARGEPRWAHIRAKVVDREPDGRPRRIVGVTMDVTDRRNVTQQLTEAQAKLKLAMDIAAVGYWEWDPGSGGYYFSPEWKRLLGYGDEELTDDRDTWLSRLHPDDRERVRSAIEDQLAQGEPGFGVEVRLRHRDGRYRWFLSRALVMRDPGGAPARVQGVILDITERKEVENRIRQVSQHDPLTCLPNRALIYEFAEPILAAAARNGRRAAVLFVDMDRFKPINDQHGHEVGDEALKEIARRLRTSVRESDLVGRLGGDEFLVVLTDIRSDEAVTRVARVCIKRLGQPYLIRGLSLETTPSIGISLFPQDGADMDALIRKADAAMYEAKRAGRNSFRYYRPERARELR